MIRHAVGSRLFFKTDNFNVTPKGEHWEIKANISDEAAAQIKKFYNELNVFVVDDHDKTWFYASDRNIKVDGTLELVIQADHKTVYPK